VNSNNELKYPNLFLFDIFLISAFTSVYIHTAPIPAEPAVPLEKYTYTGCLEIDGTILKSI